jgi:hypothetical protein
VKNIKKEDGVIIIDAAISLPIFMFLIITILSVVNICYTQSKIATALNETAKEISEYSYLYSLTGLNKKQAKLYKDTEQTRGQLDQSIDGVHDLFSSFEDGKKNIAAAQQDPLANLTTSTKAINTDIENSKNATEKIKTVIDQIKDDPKKFVVGMAKLLGNEAINEAKSKLIAAPIAKCMMKRHVVIKEGGDCESYLKQLRIVKGADGTYLGGINFGGSELFPDGNDEIILMAKYKIKVLNLLPIKQEIQFSQVAETDGWFGGKDNE